MTPWVSARWMHGKLRVVQSIAAGINLQIGHRIRSTECIDRGCFASFRPKISLVPRMQRSAISAFTRGFDSEDVVWLIRGLFSFANPSRAAGAGNFAKWNV